MLGNSCKVEGSPFYFEDGDGNLGLPTPDETSSDTTNLFLKLSGKLTE